VKYFDQMVNKINDRVVSILMRAQVPELQIRQAEAPQPPRPQQRLQESHGGIDEGMRQAASHDTREQQPIQPIRRENLPGRNDLCPCGSGKKFKHCHGRNL
jgi:preprotein translocase subunit SecA